MNGKLNRIVNYLKKSLFSTRKLRTSHNKPSSKDFYKPLTKDNLKVADTAFIDDSVTIKIRENGVVTVGDNTQILDGVILMSYFDGNITIGKNCSINPYTIIYGVANTTIGDNVLIAGHCMIIPSNHNYSNKSIPINSQGNTYKGIVIEDDVWIGHACSILDGVTISRGAIVAAGSVVNESIPAYTIYGGNPARFIKNR